MRKKKYYGQDLSFNLKSQYKLKRYGYKSVIKNQLSVALQIIEEMKINPYGVTRVAIENNFGVSHTTAERLLVAILSVLTNVDYEHDRKITQCRYYKFV